MSGDIVTGRLVLRLIDQEHISAVVDGRRLPDWAPGYPSDSDRRIAALLARQGVPTWPDAVFGRRLVVERRTGQVVGGVGLKGPPTEGRVELGYGIVESRRGRGYATEAARALVELALTRPGVTEVVAGVDTANRASVRVLEKAGFTFAANDGDELWYSVRSTL